MSFLACSGVSVFTVGGTYGFLFIVLFPLLFSPLNGIVPRVLGVEDQWTDFVTKSESPVMFWLY